MFRDELAVGKLENWEEAFGKGNIWSLRDRQKRHRDTLKEGDVILFYPMRMVISKQNFAKRAPLVRGN